MPADVLGSAAMQMFFGGLFLVLAGTALGEWGRLSFNAKTSAAMLYLLFAGSVIAFAAYSYALRHLDVATVSLYTYINPIIAVALGTLVLGEPFHIRMIVGAGIILGGAFIVGPGGIGKRRSAIGNRETAIGESTIDKPAIGNP
jgi:drug/metabolite transporter (DMT)-like permease